MQIGQLQTMRESTTPPRVERVFNIAKGFTESERLVLAKLLLDSLVVNETTDESDWDNMSLAAFEKEWDNPDDAVYDNWRELYGVSAD